MVNIHTSLYDFMKTYHAKDNTLAIVRGHFKMRFDRFFAEIDRVAGGLYKMGVRKGDVVMLTLPNIPQSVVATYALSRIGAVASMIHPKLSADEFAKAVKKQHPKVVFLSDINFNKFYKHKGDAKCVLCNFFVYDYIGLPCSRHFDAYNGDGEEIMFYMQSGGTSGEPKTVMLSSRSCNAMAHDLLTYLDDKFTERNAMLVVMPMFHGYGLCVGMHASLCTNMRVVLLPQFSVKSTTNAIAKNRVTTMLAVPRMVSKLLAYDKFSGHNISCLEDVFVGGDTVGDELVEAFDKRMQECGGSAKLSPGYGLSETVTVCAVTKGEFVEGSVGRAIDNVAVKIVDENDVELPIGEKGELLINAEQMMSGYLGDKDATDSAFALIDGKKWLRTGDIFKTDEKGYLYFLGRKKRLIKISGVNVFPVEIERTAKELDYIKDCACIEYRVADKPFIKLIVEGQLDEWQKQNAINYIAKKMSHWNIPSKVVCLDEFPRTSVGKTDITTLQELFGGEE